MLNASMSNTLNSEKAKKQVQLSYFLMLLVLNIPLLAPLQMLAISLKLTKIQALQDKSTVMLLISHYQHQLFHLSVYLFYFLCSMAVVLLSQSGYFDLAPNLTWLKQVLAFGFIFLGIGAVLRGLKRIKQSKLM